MVKLRQGITFDRKPFWRKSFWINWGKSDHGTSLIMAQVFLTLFMAQVYSWRKSFWLVPTPTWR